MFLHSYTNKDEDMLSASQVEIRRGAQTVIYYSVYPLSFQYFYRLIPFLFHFLFV